MKKNNNLKDLTFLTNSLIAHRGVHNDLVLENTLLSFKKAVDNKYIIELDIHLLYDGEIVVFHDYNLKRLTGINKMIEEMTYKELKKIALKTGEHIPRFMEVLKLVNGRVPILIEIKSSGKVGALEQRLSTILDSYNGKFAIQSFNPLTLLWFKKNRKNYIRGQLVTLEYNYNFIVNLICKYMILNPITKPDFISCNIKKLPNQRLRNKYVLLGWTVRNVIEYNKYINLCDNLIVENIL